MKKLLTLIFSLLLCVSTLSFVACGENSADPDTLSVYAPDGAPALSIAKFIADEENFGDYSVSYNIVAATDIGGVMQRGEGDVVIIPVNAASKLYKANASDPYVMASVVTHGNLYLVSKSEITLTDLKGKVVGVIGQGNVPDLTLRAVLDANGITYRTGDAPTEGEVTLNYFGQATDLMPMLKQNKVDVGLLPEPAATKLQTSVATDYKFRLDLQKLYAPETEVYPQAVLMVKKSVAKNHSGVIAKLKEKFADNLSWVKANTSDAVTAVNAKIKDGVTPSLVAANITEDVVNNCKIYWQDASAAKSEVIVYLQAIKGVEDKSAVIPSDDFFLAD